MKQVLACIDGSYAAESVCDYAAWASSRLHSPLTLLHVLDEMHYPSKANLSGNLGMDARDNLLQELAELDVQRSKLALEQGRRMLTGARERVASHGVTDLTIRQHHGHFVESLQAMEVNTSLLVMGKSGEAHAADGPDAHLGDNVEKVIRALHCPVLLAQGEFKTPNQVMLAFDNSGAARKGVEMLANSPLFSSLTCHLVAVSDKATLNDELKAAQDMLEAKGHHVEKAIVPGEIEPALHQYQQDNEVDMVVMGAYGHSRLREWLLGSTTNDMIRHAKVPHLLLRS